MARPATRQAFKEWCLTKLGKPVIEINVSDEQIEDRIDEAILFWNDYHFAGSDKVYIKHQLTQTDVDNKYVTVPTNLVGVVRIFDMSSAIGGGGSGMFSANYQFVWSNMSNLSSFKMSEYYMTMQYLSLIDEVLTGKPQIRYNRHLNRLFLDVSSSKLVAGSWIVIEAYEPVDENEFSDMWADRWLGNYATSLIKEQWGTNLTKFVGMQLPGGVQFNGEMILNDAREERRKLEEEVILNYSLPVNDFIG